MHDRLTRSNVPMRLEHAFPYIEVLFAVVVWGASFVATKVALQQVSPVTIIWLRFAMGVVILGFAVAVRGQFSLPTWKDAGYFALLGFIGITWHQWLQATGLQTAQATTTAWIVASTPVFMALLAWLILRERLRWGQIAGIFVAGAGVLLVVSKGDLQSLVGGQVVTRGDLLILLSAPNWAIFSTLSRSGLKRHPAARMMFYVMALGWLFSSALLFNGPGLSEISQLSGDGWIGVLFLGIACSGLAYIGWYDALKAIPASQVGSFLYLEPLVTVIVAGVILGEPFLWASGVGGGLILSGVWMVNRVRSARQQS